jgi:peptide/nickel transport system substrate-binding protein
MSTKQFSRREFLKVAASGATAAIVCTALPSALPKVRAQGTTYKEAPSLAQLVAEGKLPPVNERLPRNPRVMPVRESIGQYGGKIRRAYRGLADRWSPAKFVDEMDVEWQANDDGTLEIVPNFCSAWSMNDDATEVTFTLRDGLRWSDGEVLDTDDVKFWYEQMYRGPIGPGRAIGAISIQGQYAELEVVDKLTFRFKFPKPNPLFIPRTARFGYAMPMGPTFAMPEHYLSKFLPDTVDKAMLDAKLKEYGVTEWKELFGVDGLARGPLTFWWQNADLPVMTAWTAVVTPPAEFVQARRNPYYHAVDPDNQQLPYVDEVEHRLFESQDVFDLWVVQGLLDSEDAFHLATANFTLYKENEAGGGYKIHPWPGTRTTSLFFNLNVRDEVLRNLFNTPTFREALSLAINRQEISDLVYSGLLVPRQTSPVRSSPWYDAEWETKWAAYDPDRANQLLDELGLTRGANGIRMRPDGKPLFINLMSRWTTGTPIADEMTLVEKYWEAIGVDINQDIVERSLFEQRQSNADHEIAEWEFDSGLDFTILGDHLVAHVLWCATYRNFRLGLEGVKEEPPADHPIRELWRLYDAAAAEGNEEKRRALFVEFLNVHKAAPYIIGTVGEGPELYLSKSKLRNFAPTLPSDEVTRHVSLALPPQFYFEQ